MHEDDLTCRQVLDELVEQVSNAADEATLDEMLPTMLSRPLYNYVIVVDSRTTQQRDFISELETNEMGLIVLPEQPWLRRSPDGIANLGGETVLIEIKCTYKYRNAPFLNYEQRTAPASPSLAAAAAFGSSSQAVVLATTSPPSPASQPLAATPPPVSADNERERDPPASIPGVPPGGESKEMVNDDCQGIPQLPSAGMCGAFGRTSPGHEAALAHSPPSAGRDELEGSWPRSRPTSLASPEPHSGFVGGGASVAQEEEANESVVWAIGPMDAECLLPANENEAQSGGPTGVPVDTAMMPDEVNGMRADLADISDETPSGAVSPGGSVVAQSATLLQRFRSSAVPVASAYQPWTEAQMRILAQAEAGLPPGERLVNAALAAVYTTRSLDAIKNLRRQTRYREILAEESAQQQIPASEWPPRQEDGVDLNSENADSFASDLPSAEHAYDVLLSWGLDDRGLAINLTSSPLTMSDLRALYEFFGIKIRRGKTPGARQGDKCKLQRRPDARSRSFKRRLYAEHQRLYGLGPKVLLEELISCAGSREPVSLEDIHETFDSIFTSESPAVPLVGVKGGLPGHCRRFSSEEVALALKGMATASAPGPDGLTVREMRKIPPGVLALVFSNWLTHHNITDELRLSRTVFLPKSLDTSSASDLRPITISSALLRLYFRLLLARLQETYKFHPLKVYFPEIGRHTQTFCFWRVS
ncbi:hypothetical protein HPB49_013197 [Dermacentor silvarum]|uniref:Uncharacterized protein n=1 Tax=Dermacentor silvarum TaxID=543639 RepID=A0ACB8CXK5_DERSI|nr:hypothetical protein HPB49_013197 [Dermacentor silvarum]